MGEVRSVTVVANITSGSSEDNEALTLIRDRLTDITVVEINDPKHLERALVDAARDAEVLGVYGGDGTISAAAAVALEADIPLAIFPGGTLNHFARDVGIGAVDEAIEAFLSGALIEADVGVIDGKSFLNTASFGSYSEFVEAREANEKRIGKWPAAIVALAKVMRSSEPLDVVIDGQRQKIWMIFIGNCSYDPPGFVPASRERLDDGYFDVRIVDGTRRYARSKLLLAVLSGRLNRSKVYTRRLVQQLDVEIDRSDNILAADGETFDGNSSFRVTKTDRRLRIYAPCLKATTSSS